MRLLIDTHTFLWYITDADQLSAHAEQAISAAENEVLLSIGSLWEIAIKHGLGKLDLPKPFQTFIPEQLLINRIETLPIALSHLAAYAELPLHHRDPFDRIIIAQAVVESIPVVSIDESLRAYPITIFW